MKIRTIGRSYQVTLDPNDFDTAVDETPKRVVRARGCNAEPSSTGMKILYVDVNLHQALKIRAVHLGLTIQELTAMVIQDELINKRIGG